MKKIYKIIFLLILNVVFIIFNCFSQQITFQKTYGGSDEELSFTTEQTFDGGYIIGGATISYGNGNDYDMYLIKTNSAGDTLWTRTFGKNGDDRLKSVHQTADSGYICAGYVDYDTYIIKTNSQGGIQWVKNFGFNSGYGGNCIQQTADGGYIVTGSATQIGPGNYDVYLIKTNSSGDTLWTKSFGDTGGDQATSVKQTSDKGYLIAGSSWTYLNCIGLSCDYDAFMIKTDSIGDTLWTKYYGYTGLNMNDFGFDAIETNDGSYALIGSSDSLQTFLLKTDTSGNPLWCKSYTTGYVQTDPTTPTYSINQVADGGYVLVSDISINNYYTSLIRTDSTGNILWSELFPAGGTVHGQPASDGGYIITATIGNVAGVDDIILIKTDSLGNSGCNDSSATIPQQNVIMPLRNHVTIVSSPGTVNSPPDYYAGGGSIVTTLCTTVGIPNLQSSIFNLQFYPNPLTTQSKLTFKNPNKEKFIFTLYDITGRITESVSTTNNEIILTKGSKPAGVYLFNLVNEKTGERMNGKIVIE